jgi:hypothetical protein
LNEAAHRDGLIVLASVDSASFGDDVWKAHPEWAARTQAGQPVRADSQYVPCVNSPYLEQYLHPIFQEILSRARPEGILGKHWEGLGRNTICFCDSCARIFRQVAGKALPKTVDWSDPAYRDWIRWNYARRLEIWDLNNRVTKAAGGANCLWIGMNAAALIPQSMTFRNTSEIAKRTPLLIIEGLSRDDATGGFWQNSDDGRYFNGLGDWKNVVVESTAMYQRGSTSFIRVSTPPAEARLWMLSGIAGGFQPKYEGPLPNSADRRMYQIPGPLMLWHKRNEAYLVNRTPVATVGVVWSQSSSDFYGRDAAAILAETPYRGMLRALYHSRIPAVPVDINHIEREAEHLAALVLPNIGSMSDEQCAAVTRFVERGGGLIATGVTSIYDTDGEPRADFGLASILGAHLQGPAPDRMFAMTADPDAGGGRGAGRRGAGVGGRAGRGGGRAGRGRSIFNSYLRLRPELRATMSGPHKPNEPHESGSRHPALAGFEATDVIPFGGVLVPSFRADSDRSVLCTYVPSFPTLPTDAVWMRVERTDIPGLIVGSSGKGKVAFMPADLDRLYGADPLPDHGRLLGNLLRWIAGDNVPITVEGTGTVGVYLYRQERRLVLHLVNETGADNQRPPIGDFTAAGAFSVNLRLPAGVRAQGVKLLVSGQNLPFKLNHNLTFEVPRVTDHEVVVIE